MAKRATTSQEVRRTIILKFLTDRGKIYRISLNCASAKLAGEGGADLVKGVMERLLKCDVFTVKLVKAVGAELVERRVILSPEDFQGDSVRSEDEIAPETRPGERYREMGNFGVAGAVRRAPQAKRGAGLNQPAVADSAGATRSPPLGRLGGRCGAFREYP